MMQRDPNSSEPAERQPYAPPRLVDHGSLVELTRGGDFLGSDGQSECNPPGNPDANSLQNCEAPAS